MLPLTLILALLASSASARFMPVHRLASLEGMAVDSDGESSVRPPRHALAFAAFDRPLSPDPHHRVARGAAEACDCADDPDLVAEIDEKPPVMEETLDAPVYQQQPPRPAHFEELHGSALSADDAELADDQEATLGDGGLEPLLEAGDEAGAGRPARQTDFEEDPVQAAEEQTPEDAAHKVEDSEEQAPQAAEAVEGESQVEDVPETDASLPAPEGARAVEDAAEAPQGEPDALAAPVAPAAPAAPAAAAATPDDVPAPQGAEGASA